MAPRFTWSEGESLDELARPERVAQIRAEHQRRLERMSVNLPSESFASRCGAD